MSSAELSAPPEAGGRWLRPSIPEDGPAIVALMKQAGLQPHEDPRHLHWKYWQAHPDWPGSRSYVLTDGKDILAHGAVCSGTMRWDVMEARVIHMIDWAARHDSIGAGVLLMKHIARMTDFLLAIGGSRHTLRIMPRTGFRLLGTVTGYVRTLSPLRILERPCQTRWKVAPRIARSALWSMTAPRARVTDWQVRRIEVEEVSRIEPVLPHRRADLALLGRTPDLLRHILASPIVPVELYALEKAGRMGGYFILSYAPGQARLADLWMASEDPADWRALVHAAVRQSSSRGGLAELAAWSSDPELARVFEACGFHPRVALPMYLRSTGEFPVPEETHGARPIKNRDRDPQPIHSEQTAQDGRSLQFGGARRSGGLRAPGGRTALGSGQVRHLLRRLQAEAAPPYLSHNVPVPHFVP